MNSLRDAGNHARIKWNRKYREMEAKGYVHKDTKVTKTLLEALPTVKKGMDIEARRNLLISTLVLSAGHVLGE